MNWISFGNHYRINQIGIVQSCFSGEWKMMKSKRSKTDNHGGYYLTVGISKNHKRLHLLMWEIFNGPRTKGKVINHIDGNRDNCAIWNLEEITQKQNIQNVISRGKFKLFGKYYDNRKDDSGAVQPIPEIDREDFRVREHSCT